MISIQTAMEPVVDSVFTEINTSTVLQTAQMCWELDFL